MSSFIKLLEVDQTFFIQFGIFVVLFITLPTLLFRPFQRLIELRLSRTLEDKAKATELVADADRKYEEYKSKLAAERTRSRAEIDKALLEVKAHETSILNDARNEAKKITQIALEGIQQQNLQLRRSLEADVESMALQITDLLLKRHA